MLEHPKSISISLVKRPFPGPINPNSVSCPSISLTEISVFVSINHTAIYSSNDPSKLLDISESSCIVYTIYSFSLM